MSVTDKDVYRLVPFRFLVDEANTDICKLEKLTNLFPDVKAIIELELFKINNLNRMMDRLSSVFTVLTAINTHDDTIHHFFGPYHLSLGPTYGALHFKNVSKALLASKQSKTSGDNTHKRRHEAVLRRFRRTVRKLIHIKSIIDELRLASILTPYNQYELYTNGIYDLVLSGHIHNSSSPFDDEDLTEQINNIRSRDKFQKETSLLASKFVKINTLLQLLSSTQNQSDNHSISQNLSDDSKTYPKNENSSKSLLDSTNLCCAHHCQNMPLFMYPTKRSISQQSTHFLQPESRPKHHHKHNLRRNSLVLPNQSITNSLPDLFTNDKLGGNIPSNSNTLEPGKSENLVEVQLHVPSFRLNSNQEDVFVNRISSLLTNYLLTRESSSDTDNNHEKLEDNTGSFSSLSTSILFDDSDISNQFSAIIETNEFDKLFQRIKTVVNNNLSRNSLNTTATDDLRKQLLISHQEPSTNEFNVEHMKSSINKPRLHLSSKSQSFDDTNSNKD